MVNDINTITLSGEVSWVRKKYTSAGALYIIFAIKQKNIEFKDKVMVGRNDDTYFVSCFQDVAVRTAGIREGDIVAMTGHVTPFTMESGKSSINIIADKIVRYGNKNHDNNGNQEQTPWNGSEKAKV
jgi:hypothetical protein